MPTVVPLHRNPQLTISTDKKLISMMQRAVDEVFAGNDTEFEDAFAEALAQQIDEFMDVSDGINLNMKEELADAMRAVLLQWLGEHTCCPREDMELLLASITRG